MEKIRRTLNYELVKYKNKGLWIIPGVILFISFFLFYPKILKLLYPFIHDNIDPKFYVSIITPALHIIIFLTCNLFMGFIYYLENPFFERFKCNRNSWPWKENKEIWGKLMKNSFQLLLMNIFLIGPGIAFLFSFNSSMKFKYNDIPDTSELAIQILFCVIINDLAFHIGHKLMHTEWLYKNIHYIHHQYNNPIGISAEYSHPIEYIFATIIPAALGPLLLSSRIHITTAWGWLIWGIGATVEQHCGYDFPFSPYGVFPLTFTSQYHDYHHTKYKYNYSSNFTFWDTLFGDNTDYFNFFLKSKRKESAIWNKLIT
jgi:sterol desaturase/sphingolipid hydroxylase (fatty acid hydroxylase superfamily)